MKESPIIFSAPMIRCLLAGTKTQTRRALKPQPHDSFDDPLGTLVVGTYHPTVVDRRGEEGPGPETFGAYTEDGEWALPCPFGRPGDLLWVREAHALGPVDSRCLEPGESGGALRWPLCTFKADGATKKCDTRWSGAFHEWRSPIHMPRWASRITLEITDVRVERLNSISEADAIDEGIVPAPGGWWSGFEGSSSPTATGAYALLWERINGAGSWDANPFVWAVAFRLLDRGEVK